jgi:hypothetical protein
VRRLAGVEQGYDDGQQLDERPGRTLDGRRGALRLDVRRGAAVLGLLGHELDDLADRCDAPSTARPAWLRASVQARPRQATWSVAVRDDDHLLRAALVVHEDLRADHTLVSLAGCTSGHCSAVLADSREAAALLGYGFGRALQDSAGPVWTLLGPVPDRTPWLADFVSTLPGGELVGLDGVPAVRRTALASARDYLGASLQRTLRKAANRAAADGAEVAVAFTRDAVEIAALLPALEQLHRDRDHDQDRPSELDDPGALGIWRARVTGLAAAGRLEVATLRVDGALAAQVIGIVDPGAYRVLEGVLATRFSRYSPGRVLETAVLQRVLDDPSVELLDWMTGVAPEALLAANHLQPVSAVRSVFGGTGSA